MGHQVLWGCSANGNTSGLQPEIESSILSISTIYSPLAQLGEHDLDKVGVPGSKPGRATNNYSELGERLNPTVC